MILLACLAAYIIGCSIILFKNKNNLKNEEFVETYGEMMQGLNVRDRNSIYIYPIFMQYMQYLCNFLSDIYAIFMQLCNIYAILNTT